MLSLWRIYIVEIVPLDRVVLKFYHIFAQQYSRGLLERNVSVTRPGIVYLLIFPNQFFQNRIPVIGQRARKNKPKWQVLQSIVLVDKTKVDFRVERHRSAGRVARLINDVVEPLGNCRMNCKDDIRDL